MLSSESDWGIAKDENIDRAFNNVYLSSCKALEKFAMMKAEYEKTMGEMRYG